ncbi:hypothetical protein ACFYXM_22235 [Streptomyces sp. NPDC002476]|uniref:hypothetical protein n=1 Tax=Streptomyces sp. NPDC002476 TaxID=3364648 RepID=UPI003695DF80
MIDGVKAGSWLHRQFTTWHELNSGQRDLLTSLGLTADQVPLRRTPRTPVTSGTRKRRFFEQTALLLRAFVERHGRPPGAREWIEVDGERVMIGPWLCKTRTKQKADQLPKEQSKLMDEILREDRPGTAPDVPEEGPTDISKVP